MTSKWVKAAFLILLGIVLLYYQNGFIEDLERNSAEEFNISFEWTWDLLQVLIWILVAWLFVYAALTIALSFRTDLYTLNDVMSRLAAIEKRLPAYQRTRVPAIAPVVEPSNEAFQAEEPLDNDVPPPPVE